MKLIKINGSHKYGIVDDVDYERVVGHRWYLNTGGYPRATIGGRVFLLHRLIMGEYPEGKPEIDHKNRVRIDCRRANLRFCTRQENTWNSKTKQNEGAASQYQGVKFCHKSKTWIAKLMKGGQRVHQTNHETETEAARYYNEAAKKHFGEFAYQNEI